MPLGAGATASPARGRGASRAVMPRPGLPGSGRLSSVSIGAAPLRARPVGPPSGVRRPPWPVVHGMPSCDWCGGSVCCGAAGPQL